MKYYAIDGAEDVDGATVSPPNVIARYRMFKIGDDGLTEPERRIAALEAELRKGPKPIDLSRPGWHRVKT